MPALTEDENSVWLNKENGGKRKWDLSSAEKNSNLALCNKTPYSAIQVDCKYNNDSAETREHALMHISHFFNLHAWEFLKQICRMALSVLRTGQFEQFFFWRKVTQNCSVIMVKILYFHLHLHCKYCTHQHQLVMKTGMN